MARQLRAFRAGFVDIVPCGIESAFASFTPEESLDIVCGAAVNMFDTVVSSEFYLRSVGFGSLARLQQFGLRQQQIKIYLRLL